MPGCCFGIGVLCKVDGQNLQRSYHSLGRSDPIRSESGRSLSTCAIAAFFCFGKRGTKSFSGGWVVRRPCPEGYSAPWKFNLGTPVLRELDHDFQMVDVSSDCSYIG